jgi:hypothetical protein
MGFDPPMFSAAGMFGEEEVLDDTDEKTSTGKVLTKREHDVAGAKLMIYEYESSYVSAALNLFTTLQARAQAYYSFSLLRLRRRTPTLCGPTTPRSPCSFWIGFHGVPEFWSWEAGQAFSPYSCVEKAILDL